MGQWLLWRQGPSGEDPWATLRPPDRFPACLGREKLLFGLNYVKISQGPAHGRALNGAKSKEGRRRAKSHYIQNFETGNFRFSQSCS